MPAVTASFGFTAAAVATGAALTAGFSTAGLAAGLTCTGAFTTGLAARVFADLAFAIGLFTATLALPGRLAGDDAGATASVATCALDAGRSEETFPFAATVGMCLLGAFVRDEAAAGWERETAPGREFAKALEALADVGLECAALAAGARTEPRAALSAVLLVRALAGGAVLAFDFGALVFECSALLGVEAFAAVFDFATVFGFATVFDFAALCFAALDLAVLDFAVLDFAAPDFAAPDFAAPDLAAPDLAVFDFNGMGDALPGWPAVETGLSTQTTLRIREDAWGSRRRTIDPRIRGASVNKPEKSERAYCPARADFSRARNNGAISELLMVWYHRKDGKSMKPEAWP